MLETILCPRGKENTEHASNKYKFLFNVVLRALMLPVLSKIFSLNGMKLGIGKRIENNSSIVVSVLWHSKIVEV